MTSYTYEQILAKAKAIKKSVEKEYKIGESTTWSYYIAKAIISPKKDIAKITVKPAPGSTGKDFSRQITHDEYISMAKRLIKYVTENNRLPNYITIQNRNMRVSDYTYMFSRVLVYYGNKGVMPSYANVNSKAFTKPTETSNTVYDDFVKKTGKKFTTLDDLLAYVKTHGRYIFEFDDVRSNAEVTKCMCGNCTDWLQWLWNMATAMGYECKAIHVKCRVSGTGHVRGQFKHAKNTGGKWIDRDPAAVASGESITSIWCSDGYKLAENPSWFLANLNR